MHYSRRGYAKLQDGLTGDTDEIGHFLDANAKVDQSFSVERPPNVPRDDSGSDDENSPMSLGNNR